MAARMFWAANIEETNMIVHVIAVITAHPGKRQDILDVLLPALPGNLPEKGCIEYTVTTDAEVVGAAHAQTKFGPDTFVIIEKWKSIDHLQEHSSDPEVLDYLKSIEPYLASRITHFTTTAGEFHFSY
jgi:quinol monooxygenase YgiN